MPTPIEQLRAAGFSDDEIGAWSTQQRGTLKSAGFDDDEIDNYLGGPKPTASPSFLDRLSIGSAILDGRVPTDKGAYSGASMGEYGPGNFLIGLWRGLTTPGAELKQSLQGTSPGQTAGAIVGRLPVGQIIDQIRQGGDQLQRAVETGELPALRGNPLAPGGVPGGAEEMVGNALLGMTAPITRLPGGAITRMERAPDGTLREVPIGDLPDRGDAQAAATAATGVPHPGAQAKVEKLWQDHGIHPAEVAHDAARDPTIAQDLLSSTPELPRAYVKPEDQPKVAAAPPAETPPAAPASEPQLVSPPEGIVPPQLRTFAPGDLRVDAQRFQFKEGGDAAGVTDRLQGVTQWDPLKAGLTVVYEDKDGQHWIADGHQRLGLAQRIAESDPAQDPRLNSWVLREADGVTGADVRAIAAAKNIAEGTGTAVDAAKVLRDRPDLVDSLPPRSELVRQAQGLMNLDPDAFGKVVNDVVPPNYAAIVGRLVQDDPKMQNALIDLLAKTDPQNAVQAESIVRSGIDAGLHTDTQATLFGDQELVSSLYADRARILDRSLKQLRRDRTVFQSIVDNSTIIEDLGNKLAQDANAKRAAIDGHALQILQTLANRRGALSDALTGLARSVASGDLNHAAAARDFVAEIRRQAESGALTRGADGGSGGAVAAPRQGTAGTGNRAKPAVAGAERSPRDVRPAEEARATTSTEQAIGPPRLRMIVNETDLPLDKGDTKQVFLGWDDTAGNPVATGYVKFRDGGKTAYIESVSTIGGEGVSRGRHTLISGQPNRLGPRTVREMARQLLEEFPEVDRIEGLRISGARSENAPVAMTREQVLGRRAEQARTAIAENKPIGFSTSKGSTYEVHEDGTTTRNKSFHPEHGAADVGLKPRSAKTIYVDSAGQATSLSAAGLSGVGPKGARLVLRDGKASLLMWNEKADRWGVSPSSRDIPFTTEPEVGKYPVEAWKPADDVPGHEAYSGQHAGNEIVSLRRGGQAPAVEQTDQGTQLVMPGAERSARQAAQAREDAGHGRATTNVPQKEPGGLFEPPKTEEPDLFFAPKPGTPPVGMGIGAPPPTRTAAERAILDRISIGERTDKRPWSWSRLYTDVMDRLYPISDMVAKTGEELPTSRHPYQLARLLAGNAGRAQHWLDFGQVDFKTGEKIGPALKEIIAPFQHDLDGLRAFADAVRSLELEHRGIETGMNVSAAREVAAAGLDKYAPTLARLIQYQDNLSRYLLDAGVLSQKGYEAMREANQLYVPFYRVIGDEPGRGLGGGSSITATNPIHRIKGSEREVIDPIEGILRNTFLHVTMAERNRVGNSIVDLLRSTGDAHGRIRDVSEAHPRDSAARGPAEHFPAPDIPDARQVPGTPAAAVETAIRDLLHETGLSDELFDFLAAAAPPREGEISIYRNGKRETWLVGKDIADAVKGLDVESSNTLLRMLAAPARLLRAGATLSPDFMLRNPVRDFFSAFVQTSTGVFTPIRSAKGLYSAVVKDEHFQDWLKSGGGNASLVAMDRRYLQESLRKLTQDTGLMSRAWNVVRHPIDALRMVSELSEQMTRLGEFRAVQRRELRRGATPKEASETAAFASRESTIDFSRIGAKMRAANMAVAFMNPQLQGVDRVVRAIKDNPVGTGIRIAAGITAPSVLLWWANHDDPRYQEIPQWERDLFWIIPTEDHIWRIPKPFELGVLFGSGVERALDAFVDERPDAFDGLGKSIAGALLPSVVPTAALPLVEQWSNRSMFTDRNLIPADAEKLLPEYQYNPYTTETAKKLGQIFAAFPGMREAALGQGPAGPAARALTTPALIENYVQGWTGGLGVYALHAADAALRKEGLLPDPPKPADTLSDIPVVKAFVVRYPSASAESIQKFYDGYERNKRYFDTWMAKAQEGDQAAMARIQNAGGQRIFVQLNGIKQTLGEHSKLVRDIWKDQEMSSGEKRQLIDQLYFSEIQIAQHANEMMRQVDASLSR